MLPPLCVYNQPKRIEIQLCYQAQLSYFIHAYTQYGQLDDRMATLIGCIICCRSSESSTASTTNNWICWNWKNPRRTDSSDACHSTTSRAHVREVTGINKYLPQLDIGTDQLCLEKKLVYV